jgi:hypothetical protein
MQPEKPKPPPRDSWARAFERMDNEGEPAGWRVA